MKDPRSADPDTDPTVLLVGTFRMKYPSITDPDTGEEGPDKTRLLYNEYLTRTK